MALKEIGVTNILATYAVGGIDTKMEPGDFAIPTQFIDFTHGRKSTFFDEPGNIKHTDVSDPYSPILRNHIQMALIQENALFHPSAVYICTNGPRYETPAEIKAFAIMGATVVGMTGATEVILSAELGIAFAGLTVITNLAAGEKVMFHFQRDHDGADDYAFDVGVSWIILEYTIEEKV